MGWIDAEEDHVFPQGLRRLSEGGQLIQTGARLRVESVGEGQGFPLALPFGEQLAERDHGRNVAVSGPKVNRAARRAAMGSGRESLPRPDSEPDLGETNSGARPDRLPAVLCRVARAEEQADGGFVAIRGCSRGHIEQRSAGESFG